MSLDVGHFGVDSSSEPVVIATGTVNALAFDPYRTWAFRRAEVTGFVGSPFRLPSGNPSAFARVRQLDPRLIGGERMVALATSALDSMGELVARIPTRARLAVALCLPERTDQTTGTRSGAFTRRRIEGTVVGPLVERGYELMTRSYSLGHAGFGHAALEVGRMLEQGTLDAALILAVDSYYDPFVLDALIQEERILDTDSREGFVPGEAASAVLLARPGVARELGASPLAQLMSVGVNAEAATMDNDLPLTGHGLSRPTVALCKRLKSEGRSLDWWLCDVTGEPYRTRELSLAWPRASHHAWTERSVLEMLPTHFGEIGAASMATGVVLGIEGLRRGDPAGSTVLVTGSSRGSARAAALLTAIPAA
ncbi:MAG: hypothetical protein AB8I08_27560 [Sandaracinaceae bacterium]